MEISKKPSKDEKFNRILENNTLFLPNNEFGLKYENTEIKDKTELLLSLAKVVVDSKGFSKKLIIDFIQKNNNGLECLFIITGLSREFFKRIITMVRIINEPELNNLLNWQFWPQEDFDKEWDETKIVKLAQESDEIAKGIVNLFFDGHNNQILKKSIELFEIKKLNASKFSFSMPTLIDTLIRYKLKGSFSGLKENNPEIIIEKILEKKNIVYTRGSIIGIERRMDFIIPTKANPEVLIEVTKLKTTSSGQGDKAKTEEKIAHQIKKCFPKCEFIGFIDGIGWYVRQGDLMRMVEANIDVFTFKPSEILRFEEYLKNHLSSNCYAKN